MSTQQNEAAVTTSDQDELWKSAAALGFSKYEISWDGFGPDQQPVRRIDNKRPLAVSVNNNGYPRVKPYDDNGKQQTVTIHSLVYGTFAGPCAPGMQIRHWDDNPWNNVWRPGSEAESVAAGGNLFEGDRDAQEADRYRNGRPRPAPRPVRHCFNCPAVLTTNGKRCHDCVVKIGVDADRMLRAGVEPWDVAERLGYPSIDGVVKLAVVHGGYGQPRLKRWLRTVAARLRRDRGNG